MECGSTTTPPNGKNRFPSPSRPCGIARLLVAVASPVAEGERLEGQTNCRDARVAQFSQRLQDHRHQKLNAKIVQGKDHAESLLMLSTGRAAAWFEDDILSPGLVTNAPDPKTFRMLPATYAPTYYGLMTRRTIRSSRRWSIP